MLKGEKMTLEVTRKFLLWCTLINYGVLLVWFLVSCSPTIGFCASMADGFTCPMTSLTFFTTPE